MRYKCVKRHIRITVISLVILFWKWDIKQLSLQLTPENAGQIAIDSWYSPSDRDTGRSTQSRRSSDAVELYGAWMCVSKPAPNSQAGHRLTSGSTFRIRCGPFSSSSSSSPGNGAVSSTTGRAGPTRGAVMWLEWSTVVKCSAGVPQPQTMRSCTRETRSCTSLVPNCGGVGG